MSYIVQKYKLTIELEVDISTSNADGDWRNMCSTEGLSKQLSYDTYNGDGRHDFSQECMVEDIQNQIKKALHEERWEYFHNKYKDYENVVTKSDDGRVTRECGRHLAELEAYNNKRSNTPLAYVGIDNMTFKMEEQDEE